MAIRATAAAMAPGVRTWEPSDDGSVSCEASSRVALGFDSSPPAPAGGASVGDVDVDWVIKDEGSEVG